MIRQNVRRDSWKRQKENFSTSNFCFSQRQYCKNSIWTSNSFIPRKDKISIERAAVSGNNFPFFTIFKVAILVLLVGTASITFVFAEPQTNSGYVQYTVTINGQEFSELPRTFTLNESVQPASQNGFVAITLALSSESTNFSYSRDLNSSSLPEIFPYISGLSNQSFSYEIKGISLSAEIAQYGNVQIVFNGTTYQASNYQVSFSATNSSTNQMISISGNLVSMPSGLIYSIDLSINGTIQINSQLLSTNLPLTQTQSNINVLGATMIGGAIVAAVAIAVPAIFKLRHKNHPDTASTSETKENSQSNEGPENDNEDKPSYWVD